MLSPVSIAASPKDMAETKRVSSLTKIRSEYAAFKAKVEARNSPEAKSEELERRRFVREELSLERDRRMHALRKREDEIVENRKERSTAHENELRRRVEATLTFDPPSPKQQPTVRFNTEQVGEMEEEETHVPLIQMSTVLKEELATRVAMREQKQMLLRRRVLQKRENKRSLTDRVSDSRYAQALSQRKERSVEGATARADYTRSTPRYRSLSPEIAGRRSKSASADARPEDDKALRLPPMHFARIPATKPVLNTARIRKAAPVAKKAPPANNGSQTARAPARGRAAERPSSQQKAQQTKMPATSAERQALKQHIKRQRDALDSGSTSTEMHRAAAVRASWNGEVVVLDEDQGGRAELVEALNQSRTLSKIMSPPTATSSAKKQQQHEQRVQDHVRSRSAHASSTPVADKHVRFIDDSSAGRLNTARSTEAACGLPAVSPSTPLGMLKKIQADSKAAETRLAQLATALDNLKVKTFGMGGATPFDFTPVDNHHPAKHSSSTAVRSLSSPARQEDSVSTRPGSTYAFSSSPSASPSGSRTSAVSSPSATSSPPSAAGRLMNNNAANGSSQTARAIPAIAVHHHHHHHNGSQSARSSGAKSTVDSVIAHLQAEHQKLASYEDKLRLAQQAEGPLAPAAGDDATSPSALQRVTQQRQKLGKQIVELTHTSTAHMASKSGGGGGGGGSSSKGTTLSDKTMQSRGRTSQASKVLATSRASSPPAVIGTQQHAAPRSASATSAAAAAAAAGRKPTWDDRFAAGRTLWPEKVKNDNGTNGTGITGQPGAKAQASATTGGAIKVARATPKASKAQAKSVASATAAPKAAPQRSSATNASLMHRKELDIKARFMATWRQQAEADTLLAQLAATPATIAPLHERARVALLSGSKSASALPRAVNTTARPALVVRDHASVAHYHAAASKPKSSAAASPPKSAERHASSTTSSRSKSVEAVVTPSPSKTIRAQSKTAGKSSSAVRSVARKVFSGSPTTDNTPRTKTIQAEEPKIFEVQQQTPRGKSATAATTPATATRKSKQQAAAPKAFGFGSAGKPVWDANSVYSSVC